MKIDFVPFKSNERCEYSYIGLSEFFCSGKSLELCFDFCGLICVYGLTCDFVLISVHFFC